MTTAQTHTTASRRDKLFQLAAQTRTASVKPVFRAEKVVSPGIARSLQSSAIRSLGACPESEELAFLNGPSQPRKPVATTNFSELSARDAGGLTFATFVKRCFRRA